MTPGNCERRHSSLVQCFWNEIRITITLKHKVFALYGMTLSNMYSRVIAPYENGQVRTFPKTFYLPRYMFSRFRMEMHCLWKKFNAEKTLRRSVSSSLLFQNRSELIQDEPSADLRGRHPKVSLTIATRLFSNNSISLAQHFSDLKSSSLQRQPRIVTTMRTLSFATTLTCLACTSLLLFLIRLYRHRRFFNGLVRQIRIRSNLHCW